MKKLISLKKQFCRSKNINFVVCLAFVFLLNGLQTFNVQAAPYIALEMGIDGIFFFDEANGQQMGWTAASSGSDCAPKQIQGHPTLNRLYLREKCSWGNSIIQISTDDGSRSTLTTQVPDNSYFKIDPQGQYMYISDGTYVLTIVNLKSLNVSVYQLSAQIVSFVPADNGVFFLARINSTDVDLIFFSLSTLTETYLTTLEAEYFLGGAFDTAGKKLYFIGGFHYIERGRLYQIDVSSLSANPPTDYITIDDNLISLGLSPSGDRVMVGAEGLFWPQGAGYAKLYTVDPTVPMTMQDQQYISYPSIMRVTNDYTYIAVIGGALMVPAYGILNRYMLPSSNITIQDIAIVSDIGCLSPDDRDCDGVLNANDNCPDLANPDQANSDNDDYGDICDNCPEDMNPSQNDTDADGVGDTCDNCDRHYNRDQKDNDNDGIGDVCEDDDGDGVPNADDNCPVVYNPKQEDLDGDLVGDVCDPCPLIAHRLGVVPAYGCVDERIIFAIRLTALLKIMEALEIKEPLPSPPWKLTKDDPWELKYYKSSLMEGKIFVYFLLKDEVETLNVWKAAFDFLTEIPAGKKEVIDYLDKVFGER